MLIQILAYLLFIQPFVLCQEGREKVCALSADVSIPSKTVGLQGREKAAAAASGIVFQSIDGGQTWQDVSAGLPENLEVFHIFAGDSEVFLGAEGGLYHSGIAPGAPILYRNNTSVAPVWLKDLTLSERITDIFPGQAGPYASSYGVGFFQKLPGTDIWKPMHNALNDKTICTILETRDGVVLVGCDTGIFKSADGGKTWKRVFSEGRVSSLVAMGDVLVGGGFRGVLRSTDGGEHWEWVLTEDGMVRKIAPAGGGCIVITGTNNLRVTADGGNTWQGMDRSLLPVGFFCDLDENLSPVRAIYDIEQLGEYLFCSHEAGISRSSDGGKTWELVLPSTNKKMFNLAGSGQVIFAVAVVGC